MEKSKITNRIVRFTKWVDGRRENCPPEMHIDRRHILYRKIFELGGLQALAEAVAEFEANKKEVSR